MSYLTGKEVEQKMSDDDQYGVIIVNFSGFWYNLVKTFSTKEELEEYLSEYVLNSANEQIIPILLRKLKTSKNNYGMVTVEDFDPQIELES